MIRPRFAVIVIAMVGLGFLRPETVWAHDLSVTQVLAVIKADGTYQIDVRVHVDALAMGVSSVVPPEEVASSLRELSTEEFDRAAERARNTLSRRVRIRFDDQQVTPRVTFPGDLPAMDSGDVERSVLGTTARLTGAIPVNSTVFTFGASRAFNAIQLTILDETSAKGAKYVLGVSENSPPYRLYESSDDHGRSVIGQYLILGFEHIVPKGLDHILFVLGLFLLSARLRPLLLQITAFTVAHSVTLALSMTGVASLPSRVVEPLIAVSIAYVAIENLCVRELRPWRPVVVFMFGLLHGMGFAGVLRELGMPEGQFVAALVSFNLGVECGQLAVVSAAFLFFGWFRDRSWYRKAVIFPCSTAIALVGVYWAIQRTLA